MSFDTDIVNNSGKGPNYPVPDSVKNKFNWGAFLFSWVWGFGNHTFIVVVLGCMMWIISILINKLFGQNITIQVFSSLAGLLMCILFKSHKIAGGFLCILHKNHLFDRYRTGLRKKCNF